MQSQDIQRLEVLTKAEQETIAVALLRAGYNVRLTRKTKSESGAKAVYAVAYWAED